MSEQEQKVRADEMAARARRHLERADELGMKLTYAERRERVLLEAIRRHREVLDHAGNDTEQIDRANRDLWKCIRSPD